MDPIDGRRIKDLMKRTHNFAKPIGMAECELRDGNTFRIPIVPGILKHPTVLELESLLSRPAVARKYTIEALRFAPWQVLKHFPPRWLMECIAQAGLRPSREKAILFLLGAPPPAVPEDEGDETIPSVINSNEDKRRALVTPPTLDTASPQPPAA